MKILLLIIIAIGTLYFLVDFDAKEFDKETWKTKPEERLNMINDLENKLEGKTREEIIDLLGYTNDRFFDSSYVYLMYYLGPERNLISIDDEWFMVRLKDGIYHKSLITTD